MSIIPIMLPMRMNRSIQQTDHHQSPIFITIHFIINFLEATTKAKP